MFIVRTIKEADIDALVALSVKPNMAGITSLPTSRKKLQEKIAAAKDAIAHFCIGKNQKYLFVLEDLETTSIVGCCGIHSQVGSFNKWCYKIIDEPLSQLSPQTSATTRVLVPSAYENPATEICSLFIMPELRHKGMGKLLSFSRLLYIGTFPERFQEMIIAEMRGPITANGISSVWQAIGEKIFNVSFLTITAYLKERIDVMSSLILKHPIYLSLLPEEIQKTIGTVHEQTQPALQMLLDQGFSLIDRIDPVDGGPWIEAKRDDIKAIKACSLGTISNITDENLGPNMGILCNNSVDFRACLGSWTINHQGITITRDVAFALKLQIGDKVAFSCCLQ